MVGRMTMTTAFVTFFIVQALFVVAASKNKKKDYSYEDNPEYWYKIAHDELKNTIKNKPVMGRAKNVILFIGDGMGPTSVTAARILAGQMKGLRGEEYQLSFDKFPHTGMAVTYSVNAQVTDSAASATAFVSGTKTRQGFLGLNGRARRGNCTSSKGNEVDSILQWFLKDGRSTGIITTTFVNHATPGATYAHTPERRWVGHVPPEAEKAGCKDVARQLVEDNPDINVILGGGLLFFKPPDFYSRFNETYGRSDYRDLTEVWQDDKIRRNKRYKFVSNKKDFDNVDPTKTDYLLGLLAPAHMYYEIERDPEVEPSLAEMTEKAIKVLQNNEKGFYLLVEGGRIDHGHHANRPSLALHDVVALSDAVEKAVQLTSQKDTLILVTGDHSHTMSMGNYGARGKAIFGKNGLAKDKLHYTTLLYGNGPGHTSPRQNITNVKTSDMYYRSQSVVPLTLATHGGEDVAMYASGPQAHLYSGVHKNNYIPMLMAYASCVGPYSNETDCAEPIPKHEEPNASPSLQLPPLAAFTTALIFIELILRQ